MDKYDIDVVLNGHDHVYSRSYMLRNDGMEHLRYDFMDWYFGFGDYNHFYDSQGYIYDFFDEQFQKDNDCDVIVDTPDTTQVNPEGTVYITGNTATGSKYYNMVADEQDYIAIKSQNYNPSYSVIRMTDRTFTIDTYEIVGDTVWPLDETFTIIKDPDLETASQKDGEDLVSGPDDDTQLVILLMLLPFSVVLAAVLISALRDKKKT